MNNKNSLNGNITLKKARKITPCSDCGEFWVRIVTVRDRITGYEQPGQVCCKCKKLEILPILGRMGKM